MKYRNLGRSGMQVSRVGLGSWLTIGNAVDQATSDRLVHRAFDLGVNLFDTADVYNLGEAERALGRAIADLRREHLVVASKCFFPMSEHVNDRGLSRKHVFESLHASLRRLQTDYLDLYQCHRPDPRTSIEETARAMDDLIHQGKVLYWGVSCWPASLIAETVGLCQRLGLHAPVSNQPPYNLFNREIEAEVIGACERLGVSQIVYSPLAQGVLSGKYRPGLPPDVGTRAANDKINRFIGTYMSESRLQQARALTELAGRLEYTASQLALAWCLRLPNVSSVIVGATHQEQLEENLAASEVDLETAALEEIEALFSA